MTTKDKKRNACPHNVTKQNQGTGKEVLHAQTQKTAPILDADALQARHAVANLARVQANRRHISPIVEA